MLELTDDLALNKGLNTAIQAFQLIDLHKDKLDLLRPGPLLVQTASELGKLQLEGFPFKALLVAKLYEEKKFPGGQLHRILYGSAPKLTVGHRLAAAQRDSKMQFGFPAGYSMQIIDTATGSIFALGAIA